MRVWTEGAPADRVRLGVRDAGVYRVTAGELAAASGLDSNAVLSALSVGGLSLTCLGRPVAWAQDADALVFYGEPARDSFAPENVYWLQAGVGVRMETFAAAPEPGAATNAWFLHAESYRSAFLAPYDARDWRSWVGSLTNGLLFGEWIRGSATETVRAQERTVGLPFYSAAAATGLVARVSAASYYDFTLPDTHVCEVWLNGVFCGATNWSGEQLITFDCPVPPGAVTNGTARLKIRNGLTAQVNDFLLLDATLVYPRLYSPTNGLLLCGGGASGTLAAAGFATAQIRVWDVTEAERPLELLPEVSQGFDGLWQAVFLCGDAAARYAVFDVSQGCFEPSVSGVRDTDWFDPTEMPELAIVTPPRRWVAGFEEAVQPLADFRAAQGLRVRVVDAEALYNAFTDGLVHPEAFRRFSAAGVTNGAGQTLRYLLFAGLGGYDYKLEVFGLGEKGRYPALFPLYLLPQVEIDPAASIYAAYMLPNDTVLGDVVGNGAPEVAVGRFLATNAADLACMVTKTIRYELTETWKKKGLFVACRQLYASDINFSNFVAHTAEVFANSGWTAKGLYPLPAPNDKLSPLWNFNDESGAEVELNEGAGLLYYFGHSSNGLLGTSAKPDYIFVTAATLKASAWTFAPVAVLMGCQIGRWTALDLTPAAVQCVAEAGAHNRTSGFAAVISPAGYVEPFEAEYFSNGFRDAVGAGALRLGDAYLAGFGQLSDASAARVQHMTLLGDPSLTFRAGQTARGTPSQWLIERGLTGDPYADLADPDGDGFATWMEAQAGTGYLSKGVKIRGVGLGDIAADSQSFAFEAVGGLNYRVLTTTNLASGVWERAPWKAEASGAWTQAAIPGDLPLKTVIVPFDAGERGRFYKVQSDD